MFHIVIYINIDQYEKCICYRFFFTQRPALIITMPYLQVWVSSSTPHIMSYLSNHYNRIVKIKGEECSKMKT